MYQQFHQRVYKPVKFIQLTLMHYDPLMNEPAYVSLYQPTIKPFSLKQVGVG
jgi:hypothetical protein